MASAITYTPDHRYCFVYCMWVFLFCCVSTQINIHTWYKLLVSWHVSIRCWWRCAHLIGAAPEGRQVDVVLVVRRGRWEGRGEAGRGDRRGQRGADRCLHALRLHRQHHLRSRRHATARCEPETDDPQPIIQPKKQLTVFITGMTVCHTVCASYSIVASPNINSHFKNRKTWLSNDSPASLHV